MSENLEMTKKDRIIKEKKPRKKVPKWKTFLIVIAILAGLVVLKLALGKAMSYVSKTMQAGQDKKQEQQLEGVFKVTNKDVKQEILTSGTTIGVEKKSYTSPVTAKVKKLYVEPGQTVRKGDVLLTYEESKLGDDLEKVKIQARSDKAAGDENYEQANKAAAKVSAAKQKEKTLKAQIKSLNEKITKLQDKVAKYEEPAKLGKKKSVKEYKKASWELEKKQNALAEKQGELETQKGIIEANQDVTVSESTKAQIQATNELSNLNVNEAQANLDDAKAGIVAKQDGIVESVEVIQGAYANETQTLFTIIDSKKIGVEFSIAKSDLGSIQVGQKARVDISGNEYEGKVDYISRVAGENVAASSAGSAAGAGGAGVSMGSGGGSIKGRILLDQPDDSIFIGVSAKVYIFVGEQKDALVIPYESLNTDVDGDFVYVVDSKNKIARKNVKVGIYSDEYYQVTEGLKKGDQVIENVTKDMKPGEDYVPPVGDLKLAE